MGPPKVSMKIKNYKNFKTSLNFVNLDIHHINSSLSSKLPKENMKNILYAKKNYYCFTSKNNLDSIYRSFFFCILFQLLMPAKKGHQYIYLINKTIFFGTPTITTIKKKFHLIFIPPPKTFTKNFLF